VHRLNAYLDTLPGNRTDNIIVGLFMMSTCLSAALPAIPAVWMLFRIITDKDLRKKMWALPFSKALLGFGLILLISTLRFGNMLSMLVCVCMLFAVAAILYLRSVVTTVMFPFWLRFTLWGAIANLMMAVVQVLRYDWAGGYRPDSWFFNPNSYSMICGFIFVSALYQWMRKMAPKPLIIAAMICCAVGLWLSNSRTGMASAILGSLLLILFLKSRKGAPYVVLGFAAACLVLLSFPGLLRLYDLGSSLGIRTNLWEAAFFGIAQRPFFGQGAWSFRRISAGFVLRGEVHAHNLVLELILTAGFVGAILLTLYLYGNIRGVQRLKRSNLDGGFAPLCFTICCMAMIHSMMDLVVFAPHNTVYIFLLLSMAGHAEKQMPMTAAHTGTWETRS